jgi:hypothetical protein
MLEDTEYAGPERRKGVFTFMNETEYELFMSTIRHESRIGAEEAIEKHIDRLCATHRSDTEALKTVVFGSRERGVIGIDHQVDNHEAVLQRLMNDIQWSKRLLYGALLSCLLSLILTVIPRAWF